MSNMSKFAGKYLYSTFGVAAALAIVMAVNLLVRGLNARVDVTEKGLYSLSKGTRAILSGLSSPVTIRYYRSSSDNVMPVGLRSYADKVRDLLQEYVVYGKGNVVLETYDPEPDSDAEDSAKLDGVTGQQLRDGRLLFLGLAVNQLDKTVPIPFLNPSDEKKLEYDITRAIYEVSHPKKPVVGLVTALPVMGSPFNMFNQRQKKDPPWIFVQELQRLFEVRNLGASLDKVPDDLDVLFLYHPQNLTPSTVYAADQFLLKGGRLVIALDPYCFAEAMTSPMAMQGGQPQPGASNVPALLAAWGLQFSEANEVVMDPRNAFRDINNPGQEEHPSFIMLGPSEMAQNDIVMSGMAKIWMVFAGAFKGSPKAGIKQEVLLHTSKDADLKKNFSHSMRGADILRDFKPGGVELPLLVRLSGSFETAFPDGRPAPDGKPKSDTERAQDDGTLKKSAKEGNVILIGDADMLFNPICVDSKNFFGQPIITVLNNNLDFIQNAIDQLSGDQNLISIRCRGSSERPFTVLNDMYAEAQKKYQKELAILEAELKEAEARINDLQKGKSDDQKFILSPEQKLELAKFRAKEAETKKKLKELRKSLRADVDNLETWVKAVNIGLVPALIAVSAILFGLYRRARSAKP